MKRNTFIKLKATFLLTVFALNTVVGFACAVGVDMAFNSKHHNHDEEATEAVVHLHKDGKRHVHEESKEKHDNEISHHHDEASNHKTGNGKDDCCNDKVANFEQLDKSVPNSLNIIHPIFFTAFVASYYKINILPYTDVVTHKKRFVRGHHPPIQDIRIAIQSFQI
jgi:hypothetical protein